MMAPMNERWQTLTGSCYGAAKAVGSYLKSLRIVGILPLDLEFTQSRLCSLFQYAAQMPKFSPAEYKCSDSNCCCQGELDFWNLTRGLKYEVGHIEKEYKSLNCLDCVNTDGKYKDEGTCRIDHYDEYDAENWMF